MDDKYYTIVDTGSLFDGLDVKGRVNSNGLFEVLKIRNRGKIVGDRALTTIVEKSSLFLHMQCIKECDYQDEMEYASDNPFGKFIRDTLRNEIVEIKHLTRESSHDQGISVRHVEFEKAVTVSVLDHGKLLFTHSFLDDKKELAMKLLTEDPMNFETIQFYLSDLAREAQ